EKDRGLSQLCRTWIEERCQDISHELKKIELASKHRTEVLRNAFTHHILESDQDREAIKQKYLEKYLEKYKDAAANGDEQVSERESGEKVEESLHTHILRMESETFLPHEASRS